MGKRWVETVFLWLVDVVTWKSCAFDDSLNSTLTLIHNKCNDSNSRSECKKLGGNCRTEIDGFYIEIVFTFLFGVFWYQYAKRSVKYLEKVPIREFHAQQSNTERDKIELEATKCVK